MSGKEVYVGCDCDWSMFKSTDHSNMDMDEPSTRYITI